MAGREAVGERLRSALHLAVLWAFACAQPVFGALGNSEIFVFGRWRGGDIVVFALLLIALPPLLLWGLEQLIGMRWPKARGWAHLCLVGMLVTLLASHLIKQVDPTAFAIFAATPLIGVAGAAAYARFDAVRLALTYLSPAPLIFAGVFLFSNPIVRLVFPAEPEFAADTPARRAPLVVLVFDELPTASLMDRHGRLDERSYPGFAGLARDATWYRRASSVFTYTTTAIPSIITGNRVPTDAPPTSAAYPRSIFTLLAHSYRQVVQQQYPFCPPAVCPEERPPDSPSRFVRLLPTIAKNGAYEVAPDKFVSKLPLVNPSTRTWLPPQAAFEAWARSIRPNEAPTLHFIHSEYPHVPWIHAEDGSQYELPPCCVGDLLPHQTPVPRLGIPVIRAEEITTNRRAILGFQQRHLAQLRDADRLLGQLLQRLKKAKLYRRALIVVTADHGASFEPGTFRRMLDPRQTAGEIMGVPLFVKLPNQQVGRVSDHHVRTIDVLPTIADVLGMNIPWHVDGKSILPGAMYDETEHLVGVDTKSRDTSFVPVSRFDSQLFRAARRNDRRFGVRASGIQLYRDGPALDLVGQMTARLEIDHSLAGSVIVDQGLQLLDVDQGSGIVPSAISGIAVPARKGAFDGVAIAVNGRVVSTAWTYPTDTGTHFQTLVPPSAIRDGANRLTILGINSKHPEGPVMRLKTGSAPLP